MATLIGPAGQRIPLEQTANRSERRRGLLKRDALIGALLIDSCRSVHTIGMRFPIDVAFVSLHDGALLVNATCSMSRGRLGLPRFRSNAVLEAEVDAFDLWGIEVGQRWGIEP